MEIKEILIIGGFINSLMNIETFLRAYISATIAIALGMLAYVASGYNIFN